MKKLILLISVLALTACGRVLLPVNYAEADKLCKSNGGIRYLWINITTYDVTCNNNAEFAGLAKRTDE